MRHADIDLLQRLLDGDVTPGERASLEARLAAEPALRARFESMSSLFLALGDDVLEPAPAGLRDDVLNALPVVPRETRSANRAQWPWSRLLLPLASAAAAIVLILATLRIVPSPLAPDGRTAGTMSGALPRPVRFELPVEGSGFHITASRDNKGLARFEMATDAPVLVSLSGAQGPVEFEAFTTPAEAGAVPLRSSRRLDWNLQPGVTLRVHCSPGPARGLVNVRVEATSGAASEIGIRLESLPVVRRP